MFEGTFNGLVNFILKIIIIALIGFIVFGCSGYFVGKRKGEINGYEKGAKDALSGRIIWKQTIKKDSVLILK